MQNKTAGYHLTPIRTTLSKEQSTASFGEDVESLEPLCTVGAAAVENSVAHLQKIKQRIAVWSSISTSGYVPEGIESRFWKR